MISLLKLLYGNMFPREVDVNRHKIIHCWDAFVNYVDSVNGRVKMPAVSLYAYEDFFPIDNKLDHSKAIIDKLLYDYDFENSEGYDAVAEARKLDAELNKADWQHFLEMSGGGIHIMPLLEVVKYQYPESAIMNFREYLKDNGFKFDQSVVAHTAQMVRICGTYNLPRKLWCVPITSYELQLKSQSELQELGKIYRDVPDGQELTFISGVNRKTLRKFDVKRAGFDNIETASLSFNSTGVTLVRPEDVKRECCKIPPNASNIQRFLLITHLIESGFNELSIEQYLEKVLSPEKLLHCIEQEYQLKRLIEKGVICYDCSKIKEIGIVDEKKCSICKWSNKVS